MPPLPGFSDNPFRTRDDLVRAALALLRPLSPYKSPSGARVRLATGTGAGFSDVSAQLEGFSRPLWAIPDLLPPPSSSSSSSPPASFFFLTSWIPDGLKTGTDPSHPEYWGDLSDVDQRMVEMEAIAFAILKVGDLGVLGLPSSRSSGSEGESHDTREEGDDEEKLRFRENLVTWLSQINDHVMPPNNWRWFRVFVNMALMRLRVGWSSFSSSPSSSSYSAEEGKGKRKSEEIIGGYRDQIERDFEALDSFYIGGGWSSDGAWGDERKQVDYYSGSFAMQFAQLLFVRLAPRGLDPERVERYRVQAGEFGSCFWRYFDGEGAAIPFGRSLTYRFAFAAFWSAASLAHVRLPPPLDSPGAVKGMLLRHLRWWARKSDIFNWDGTLNIGFTYPNMFLSEDYNSPQSVYWCLKTFVVLGLPENDDFWACDELPYPGPSSSVALVWPPRQILCNSPHHTFLLSAAQSTRKNHRSREAKYSKLAYSSAFGFSVPAPGASFLEQLAPDSTLCASFDGGETWSARWEPVNVRQANLTLNGQVVPTLLSCWHPRSLLGDALTIETSVIPPLEPWPAWHMRVHRIRLSKQGADILSLIPGHLAKHMVLHDTGFAISTQTAENDSIFEKPILALADDRNTAGLQSSSFTTDKRGGGGCGIWKGRTSSLLISAAGASGVSDFSETCFPARGGLETDRPHPVREGHLIKADANTNIMVPRAMIPSVKCSGLLRPSSDEDVKQLEWTFVTGIFAESTPCLGDTAGMDRIWQLWENKPSIDLSAYVGANFTSTESGSR